MNILIKGMDMPNNCADCVFIDYFKGQWYCHAFNDMVETGVSGRNERCPLIPVPPHGRPKKRKDAPTIIEAEE